MDAEAIVLLLAAALSAGAALWSGYLGSRSVAISREVLRDQIAFREAEHFRERCRTLIEEPAAVYVAAMKAEWYPVFADGLARVDELVQQNRPKIEISSAVHRLMYELRDVSELVSAPVLIGAEAVDVKIRFALEHAMDTLEDEAQAVIEKHLGPPGARRLRGAAPGVRVLADHSAEVLRIALRAAHDVPVPPASAAAHHGTAQLGPSTETKMITPGSPVTGPVRLKAPFYTRTKLPVQ